MADPQLAQNPELYQQALTQTFFSAADDAERQPVLTISPLSWRNEGETTLNLRFC
jgi:uncharacterized protein YdgA (DUF945 family)